MRVTIPAVLGLLLAVVPGAAQQPNRAAEVALLPAEHWTHDVLHRLDALRLLPSGFDPGGGSLTVAEAGALLDAAAGRAEAADHALQLQVLEWLERLRAEYPHAFSPDLAALPAWARLAVGASARQNPLLARADTAAPRFRPDTLSPLAALRAGATVGGRVQLEVDASVAAGGVTLREAYAASRIGTLGLWAGRRRTGFVTAAGGGLVVDRRLAWDGAGAWLQRPVRLPLLGPFRLESFLAAADSNGSVGAPWFWATRAAARPHARFGIGATRAFLFGDTADTRKLRVGEVARMVTGANSLDRPDDPYPDNQLVAVDARWLPPTGALPLELYFTWGVEDGAGAWWDSPAIIGGVRVPALPGAPLLGLGIEHAVFTGASGHGHFYEHFFMTGGWTQGGELIGHPLGGTGREWLLHAAYDAGRRGPALRAAGFRRVRPPGNRLAPVHAGTSWGAAGELGYHAWPLRLLARGGIELGDGWKTGSAELAIEWLVRSPGTD